MTAFTTLITCHANADYDAFASLIAAWHLYPNSALLFPGTQEKALQKHMANLPAGRYPFVERQNIPWGDIHLLVLVDTAQKTRLQHVHPLLEKKDITIHIWDHHPATADDVPPTHSVVAGTGSCTTLLVEELRKNNIHLPEDSATQIGMGIYGDTGSFTFSSTTARDFSAAAWLCTQGMDVNAIAEIAMPEITSLHVHALNELLESAQIFTLGNVSATIAAASMQEYMGDFAQLAQRLMEIQKTHVVFAIGGMAGRVHVVARSRNELVNVGAICARLGGGGHAYAASASVQNMTLTQVKDTVYQELYAQTSVQKLARDYMSAPAIGIEAHRNIHEADELMLHFGLKAIPVFKPSTRQCIGIFDAQTASRASNHGLGNESVETYMQRKIITIAPHAGLQSITDTIIGARQRLVPVVENNDVVGVVTRTDLINIFADGTGPILSPEKNIRKEHSVSKLLQDRLPAATRAILTQAGKLGDSLNMPVYAVGGFVRDLLMGLPNQDIDLVVEGDGIAFARALAQELHGRLREHQKFLTAVVIWQDAQGYEQHVDVATARLEYYEYPAALPTVELSSIKMDLFRRDFTINALAIRLSHGHFGRLVDFFGGQNDVKKKAINVLHTLSFVEDPTRCLRAVRFEQRYAFALGASTEKLFRHALQLKLMDRLSGSRLFHEIQRICNEENPAVCFLRLHDLSLLTAISPHLALTPPKMELLNAIKEIMDWYRLLYFDEAPRSWFVYLLALCRALTYAEASAVMDRLGLPSNQRHNFLHVREQLRWAQPQVDQWQKGVNTLGYVDKKSPLCAILAQIPLEGLLFLMANAKSDALRRNISRYLTQWRWEKCDINGADILALGAPPGPKVGEILRAVLASKIDGITPTRESQLVWAEKLLQTNKDQA